MQNWSALISLPLSLSVALASQLSLRPRPSDRPMSKDRKLKWKGPQCWLRRLGLHFQSRSFPLLHLLLPPAAATPRAVRKNQLICEGLSFAKYIWADGRRGESARATFPTFSFAPFLPPRGPSIYQSVLDTPEKCPPLAAPPPAAAGYG